MLRGRTSLSGYFLEHSIVKQTLYSYTIRKCVNKYRRFGGSWCLFLQSKAVPLTQDRSTNVVQESLITNLHGVISQKSGVLSNIPPKKNKHMKNFQLRRNKNANNVTASGKKPATIWFIKLNSFVELSASAPSSEMKLNKTKIIKMRTFTQLLRVLQILQAVFIYHIYVCMGNGAVLIQVVV